MLYNKCIKLLRNIKFGRTELFFTEKYCYMCNLQFRRVQKCFKDLEKVNPVNNPIKFNKLMNQWGGDIQSYILFADKIRKINIRLSKLIIKEISEEKILEKWKKINSFVEDRFKEIKEIRDGIEHLDERFDPTSKQYTKMGKKFTGNFANFNRGIFDFGPHKFEFTESKHKVIIKYYSDLFNFFNKIFKSL